MGVRVPRWLRTDEYYAACLALAQESKSFAERYGAIIVLDEVIVGTGYNRFIGLRGGVRPKRRIRQGYANHAEIEALNAALEQVHHVQGAQVYVAGYFPASGLLDLRKEPVFTCMRCMPHLRTHEIATIHTPTYRGWGTLTLDDAHRGAQHYRTRHTGESVLERRLSIGESGIPLARVL